MIADLLAARDSSLPLAAAALARVADEHGRAAFGDLAIAYREEFLKLRAHSRGASLPELSGLSVEEFRTSLRTSMLPRLALMKIVAYPVGIPYDDTPIAFTSDVWTELGGDRAGAADRLLEAAERALARAESASGEHPAGSGGSLLEAHRLGKGDKGRRGGDDVSGRLRAGGIVGPPAAPVHPGQAAR